VGKCECCLKEDLPCTEARDYGNFKVWPLPKDIDPVPQPETLSDLIEPIIKEFDFEKVQRSMKALDWCWYGRNENEGYAVPSIERMRETSRNLLTSVVLSRKYKINGSGGFYAEKINDEKDPLDNGLILRFILEESESYFGDFNETI
jgi:hypothetical protein